jgi:hypothetical protein
VGIGTNSPDAKLDIRGTQRIQTDTVPASLILGTNDTTDHTGTDTALAIDFRNLSTTNGVAGGLIGLDKDGLELSKILLVTDNHDANTSSIRMFTSTNAAQRTQMVNINNDGVTVGGGSSAQRALHVQGTTGMCLSDGDRDRAAFIPLAADANSGGFDINVRSGGSSTFAARVQSNGNVGIGTNSAAARLHVEDANSNAPLVQFEFTGGGGKIVSFVTNGTENGDITEAAGGINYNSNSDYRLKENEVPLSDGLERLNKLKPYIFNFKSNKDTKVDGFFAHEVQEIVPNVISGEKDAINDDGSIKAQKIDLAKLVPLLVAAVQELSQKNEALEKRIEELEK